MAIGFAKPPVSNTGVNRTKGLEIGFDWITGSMPGQHFNSLKERCEKYLGEEFVLQEYGASWYQELWKTASGACLMRRPVAGGNHCGLSWSGSVVGRFTPGQFVTFFGSLVADFEFKASRLDIRVDDYDRRLQIDSIATAAEEGHFYGLRSWNVTKSGKRGEVGVGKTVSFGRRGKSGSGSYLRIYDKFIQSLGLINAIRLECEFSGDVAAHVLYYCIAAYFDNPSTFASALFSLVTTPVDFRVRDSSGRKDRSVRFDWWEQFLDGAERIKLSVARLPQTLEKAKRWIGKSVAPMLAVICNSFDNDTQWYDFLLDLIMDGERRMSDNHRALLSAALTEKRILKEMAT